MADDTAAKRKRSNGDGLGVADVKGGAPGSDDRTGRTTATGGGAVSNTARKARKRAGLPFVRTAKKPTRPYGRKPAGLGLTTGAEIMAALVVRGAL